MAEHSRSLGQAGLVLVVGAILLLRYMSSAHGAPPESPAAPFEERAANVQLVPTAEPAPVPLSVLAPATPSLLPLVRVVATSAPHRAVADPASESLEVDESEQARRSAFAALALVPSAESKLFNTVPLTDDEAARTRRAFEAYQADVGKLMSALRDEVIPRDEYVAKLATLIADVEQTMRAVVGDERWAVLLQAIGSDSPGDVAEAPVHG